MIRVAKPGTKVVIVDETEKVVKEIYEKTPFTKKYFFLKRENAGASPVDLVPRDMLDIRSKEIGDGRLYCLSFRKPQPCPRPHSTRGHPHSSLQSGSPEKSFLLRDASTSWSELKFGLQGATETKGCRNAIENARHQHKNTGGAGSVLRGRPLDLDLQFSRALKISSSDSPRFVGWRLQSDRTPLNNASEIAVAVVTFKSESRGSVIVGRIENEGQGVE